MKYVDRNLATGKATTDDVADFLLNVGLIDNELTDVHQPLRRGSISV